MIIDCEEVNNEVYFKANDIIEFLRVSKNDSDSSWADVYDALIKELQTLKNTAEKDLL